MNLLDAWFGFCAGASLTLIVVTVWDKIEFGQWLKLCDRYEAVIEDQRKELDKAKAVN